MRKYIALTALFLIACGRDDPNLAPSENPAVAIFKS